jgi:RNA methyltransferase, TrmH family
MLSKNQIKLITSLKHKKFRENHNLFIAEGVKVIQELLDANFIVEFLFVTENLLFKNCKTQPENITPDELNKITALNMPNNCLAVFKIPENKKIIQKDLILALDDVRDPGNLGTIIRMCDWFGIGNLICSQNTVDLYNPKVVQATMGSLARVNVSYLDLNSFLKDTKMPLYGTFMEGENIYKTTLKKEGIIIMGNEANGINAEIEKIIQNRLTIPRFGNLQLTESLNVATATAIVLSEFRR